MASIDWTVLGLGALVGVGCRSELKACGRIAANTAASLAGVAAQAASSVAAETSPEAAAADAWLKQVDQRIAEKLAELGQTGGKKGN